MKIHPDHYQHKINFRSTPTFQSNNLTNNLHYLQFHNAIKSNVFYKPTVQINPFNYRERQSKLQHLNKMINFQKEKTKVKELQNKKNNTSLSNKNNQLSNKNNQLDINKKEDIFSRSILSNSAQLNLKTNLSQIASPKITSSQIYLKQQKRYNIISNLPQQNKKQFLPFPKFTIQCPNTKYICK